MLGVKQNAYKGRFTNFRNKVLEVAQDELTRKTDLTFDFEAIRKGRKIRAIKFIIRHNHHFEEVPEESLEAQLIPQVDIDEGVLFMVKTLIPDITDQEIVLLVGGYDKTLLTEALMDYSRAAAKGQIRDPRGYLAGILKNKRKENEAAPVRSHMTTEEKLNDRDWAEGLNLDDMPEDQLG